ncbi:hypothetical protein SDC9_123515 [bioreactor metagenome]|uniref:Uncharacterized protein n=1 Tax=bioreactor metagenome TaxID=1076179 RepID=A0A645CHT4_9ZZZZ
MLLVSVRHQCGHLLCDCLRLSVCRTDLGLRLVMAGLLDLVGLCSCLAQQLVGLGLCMIQESLGFGLGVVQQLVGFGPGIVQQLVGFGLGVAQQFVGFAPGLGARLLGIAGRLFGQLTGGHDGLRLGQGAVVRCLVDQPLGLGFGGLDGRLAIALGGLASLGDFGVQLLTHVPQVAERLDADVVGFGLRGGSQVGSDSATFFLDALCLGGRFADQVGGLGLGGPQHLGSVRAQPGEIAVAVLALGRGDLGA